MLNLNTKFKYFITFFVVSDISDLNYKTEII